MSLSDVNESCMLSTGHGRRSPFIPSEETLECCHRRRNLSPLNILCANCMVITGKGNLPGLPKAPNPEHHIDHSNIFNICSKFCIFVALALILARCHLCNIRGLAQSAGLDVHACLKTRFIVQQLKPSRWLRISEIPPRPRASRRCHCEGALEVCDGEQKEARSLAA